VWTATGALAVEPKGPAPKATGEVWFDHPTPAYGVAYCRFNAHDADTVNRTDKGTFYYSDNAGYYRLDIDTVDVDGSNASFWGDVVQSTHPAVPFGARVNIKVFDGGTPGTMGDLLDGAVNSEAGAPYIPITAGNLVVHTYE